MQPQERTEPLLVPILRWIGGKQNLVRNLLPLLNAEFQYTTYHEPFVGGGSLFFALQPGDARLSDANDHLIECYLALRDQPRLLSKYLRQHEMRDCAEYYYNVRKSYNVSRSSVSRAAKFIYLNRTCFNGIFRVNQRGQFNVPYGYKHAPKFPSISVLNSASKALRSASLHAESFESALAHVSSGDFVYLDPPYPPLNGTSYFTHYTAERFDTHLQSKLAEAVRCVDQKGARFLMTNADTPSIRRLYSSFRMKSLSAVRYVTCKAIKHRVGELAITNF